MDDNQEKEVKILTTLEKLIRRKRSLLALAEYLRNVSQASKTHGVSRQQFYDLRKAYEEQGLEALKEKTRVLTDRAMEFCGAADKHPYELFLQRNEIEHTRRKGKSPQTNGV